MSAALGWGAAVSAALGFGIGAPVVQRLAGSVRPGARIGGHRRRDLARPHVRFVGVRCGEPADRPGAFATQVRVAP